MFHGGRWKRGHPASSGKETVQALGNVSIPRSTITPSGRETRIAKVNKATGIDEVHKISRFPVISEQGASPFFMRTSDGVEITTNTEGDTKLCNLLQFGP